MKLRNKRVIEVTDKPMQEHEKIECPNCGGELKHRTHKEEE